MKLENVELIGKKANSVAVTWLYGEQVGNSVHLYTRTFWRANGTDNGYTYVGTTDASNGMSALELVKLTAKYTDGYTLID